MVRKDCWSFHFWASWSNRDYVLVPTSNNQKNAQISKTGLQDPRHQATKDSDAWEIGTNKVSPVFNPLAVWRVSRPQPCNGELRTVLWPLWAKERKLSPGDWDGWSSQDRVLGRRGLHGGGCMEREFWGLRWVPFRYSTDYWLALAWEESTWVWGKKHLNISAGVVPQCSHRGGWSPSH